MHEVSNGEEFPHAERQRYTELTLGPMMLLGLFFGLALLCGLCFGVGYSMGSRDAQKSAATDQKLGAGSVSEAAGALSKPSADQQKTPDAQSTAANPPANNSAANPGAGSQNPNPAAGANSIQPLVQPSPPAATTTPASAPVPSLMVQIATLSRQEDADVLVAALSKRGYNATALRDPTDNMLHVRIGPFSNRNDANAMCQKLLNDGYNAVVQTQ